MNKKSGLGRGLGALIPNDVTIEKKAKINENGEMIDQIDINLIIPNRDQPRKDFDESKIVALGDSIKELGLLQPIVLKRKGSYYEIIAGERRWRACKHVGLKKVPSIIKDVDEFTVAQLALVENVQREDLNPIEEAAAYSKLIDEFKITQDSLSKIVGKSRSYITNTIRLLKLEDYIQEGIQTNVISNGHGRSLLSLETEKKRRLAFDYIVKESLSVRKTEELVKNFDTIFNRMPIQRTHKPNKKLPEILNVEEELAVAIGTKVTIKESNGKGKILIDFYNIDDLNRILDIISQK